MAYREILERQMEYERFLIRQFRERLEQCPPGYLQHRRRRGENGGEAVYDQYYHKLPGVDVPQYLNRQMAPLINELKYKRMLEESIRRLEQNVKARERYLGACKPFDYASVSGCLPKAYRDAEIPWEDADLWKKNAPRFTQSENPYRRDQLIHATTFGLMTRSKAEASVAELLYACGFSFHYEKKLVLWDEDGTPKVRYPDFTMPIAPWFPFYMEYKGLYQKAEYRKRDEQTMRLYHLNGIYPPKNLLVFMEGPDGSFHADSILRAINGILVPLWEEFH